MENSTLVRKINMDCPICDKVHQIDERKRIATVKIKGEEVKFEERFYSCGNYDDENEFSSGTMLNENLLNARNAYRIKNGLLTSDEIVDIRAKYELSQVDFAKLLGWGEATISRYESKAIQDDAYDNMLKIIRDNPLVSLDLLQKNGYRFTTEKQTAIKKKIKDILDKDGKEYLQRKSLESEYVEYEELCDENGWRLLDVPKLEIVISYYASRIKKLYKVKLMKMLWYADALCFKYYDHSITGLVYCHEDMGALPIGHYKIGGLKNVNMEEEFEGDNIKFRFLPNKKLDENLLSKEEKNILDSVIEKFRTYNAAEIIKYMHDETAYKNTANKEIIPFSLAKEIRDFA